MSKEQLIGLDHGIIQRYGTAEEFGGETNDPVAVVKVLNAQGDRYAWIPDSQALAPETPVFLAKIETEIEKGSYIQTRIIPVELL